MSATDVCPVQILCETAAKLNFACHQSAFAFLRDLQIKNTDEGVRLNDVLVTLSSNPAFLKPKSWRVDRIAPGAFVSIKDRDVQLDGDFLLKLTDAVRGTVTITVEKEGQTLAEQTRPAELLAYNEWGGVGYMPELLAAFAMPNDPAVDRILHDASQILRKAKRPDGLDGYKSGSRQRVWEIASAIYSAIANLGISYAVPPASFERDGQKIRLPSQILENRIATCLDSTMLFASALEQAGLNPIVALPQGHAVVGVWLQPEELATVVIDEAETLRKRVQLQELVLVETTFVTSHPAPPFSKAVGAASETIDAEKDRTFNSAVDIRRARAHRISPIGLKSPENTQPKPDGGPAEFELPFDEAPTLPDFEHLGEEDTPPETPIGRLERWQRKLLDLSARNPLLNHKSPKTSLNIFCPDPGLLEDKLAAGDRISIRSVPHPTGLSQDQELHRQRTGEKISEEYARDALERKQVLVDLPEDELSRRAVEIYRKAQTALQEGGSNTLYLALGFLLWRRDEKDDRRFRAPLILLPVTLERKSVRSGVKLLASDDEPRFNTTLLELLRKDYQLEIKGLDGTLPADHSGIDVAGIWSTIRKAVKEVPGFEVIEDVVLGHFSFAKYLMWKDLVDRTDALRNSAIVKHLLDTPRDPFPSEIAFVHPDDLDRTYRPSDLLVPLPADASQMAAIATADRGKDFVIIGPPGTGKSQTISNLIAHLLGKGKTVLFVSEKTAALEVVYRRLDEVGLGRFCLQLHSNKARKADVLAQLNAAWHTRASRTEEEWQEEAEHVLSLRDQLNRLVDRLHVKRRNGMTAHHAIGVKIRDEQLAARVALSWPTADYHDQGQLEKLRKVVDNLQIQVEAVGDITGSPFNLVSAGDWSPSWEAQVVERAGRLATATRVVDQASSHLLEAVGIELPNKSLARVDALGELASVLADSFRKQTAYALEPDGSERIDALEEAVRRLKEYARAQSALSCAYDPMAWRQLDGVEVGRRWQEANAAWWPKSYFLRRRLIKEMRKAGAKGIPDPERDAEALTHLRIEGEAIDRLDKLLTNFKDWEGHTTNPEIPANLQALGKRAQSAIGKLADDASSLMLLKSKVRSLMYDGNDLLAPDAPVGRSAAALREALGTLHQACDAFSDLAGRSVRDHFSQTRGALDVIRETAENIASRHAELHDWCGWQRRRTEAMDLELEALVDAIEKGLVPGAEIRDTFDAAYCAWWSGAVIGEDEVLRTFSSPEHMAAIAEFRAVDSDFQRLTAAYIAAKLSGKLPASDDVKKSSSWGVLNREIQKRSRHLPIRQLLAEVPDAVAALSPCLMMSPLSVAQYLPADQALFDVVIFDEASQITVWDAVGTLARGRQAIVAGDPKQMPPTNFFARSDDDPDGEIEFDGDLESILDEMLGASIPKRTLNLHYRSRRESLIAFSNSRYYQNELVTFPAPVHPDHGVRLVRPDGFYARGKARHNEGEAKAIVAEILRRITHRDAEIRDRSIGVVTFNAEQQSLIENLLDSARAHTPDLEWAFSRDSTLEPVFVKNLETVQGDERDVILFSITYGPDESGHITMNFGPLNRTGGERRLNVAMTRARSEMVVFSTLKPEKIDLSRTQARAVVDLKHFLDYAERGPSALASSVYGSIGDFESPFETAVARALRDKGWEVHPQIGVSAFRIDLGVVHPDEPGVYLAGVECDGAMYHSSAYARERDKIRQGVLEGLGWTLFRVWSTDWWTNRAAAIDKLHSSLQIHLEVDRQGRKDKVSGDTEDEDVSDAQGSGDSPDGGSVVNDVGQSDRRYGDRTTPPPETPYGDRVEHAAQAYVVARFEDEHLLADPNAFYETSYRARLDEMVAHVVAMEAPIHEDVLVQRIARHHGFKRAGNRVRETIVKAARRCAMTTREDVGIFYWPQRMRESGVVPARASGRDVEVRNVDRICREEIRAINVALSLGGDPGELARALGIARVTQGTRDRIVAALSDDLA